MKPFANRGQTHKELMFSFRLSRARRVVENAFGILSSKFHIFKTAINLEPDKVQIITLASLAMHNLPRQTRPDQWNIVGAESDTTTNAEPSRRNSTATPVGQMPRNSMPEARRVREKFAEYFVGAGADYRFNLLLP